MKFITRTIFICCTLFAGSMCLADEETDAFFNANAQARAILQQSTDDQKPDARKAVAHYSQFIANYPQSMLVPPARILKGITLWRDANDLVNAEAEFKAVAALEGESLAITQAATIAKRWLARIQMTRIARACHTYYVDWVEYPSKLEDLVEEELLTEKQLIDPWGRKFDYRPKELDIVDMPRQDYTLKCEKLGQSNADTEKALAGEKQMLKKVQLRTVNMTNPPTAMIAVGDEAIIFKPGDQKAGLTALLLENRRAVFSSSDYILVLQR